ncbi:MAG: prolyl oligopeptidase family serine peptidase [Verrucomicrobiota bacterium]|jgi:prolyl oligopeptidase
MKTDLAPRDQVITGCRSLALLLLLATSAAGAPGTPGAGDSGSPSTQALAYPPARRGDVVDDYQGVKVADPYRWLEDPDSHETSAWVMAEARLTQSYLEKIPALEPIKQRLTSLLNFEKYGLPFHKGTRFFYTWNSGLLQQSVLYTTVGLSGIPAVALDPNALSTNGSLAVVGYVASRDGARLAYGVSPGGSDWTEWHIRDMAAGKDLPDVVRWTKYYQPIFAPDGQGLYYSGFPAPPPGQELSARDLGNTVYYHALGTPQSSDRKLYERTDHPDWQFEPHLTQDGRWLVLMAGEGEVGDKGLMNIHAADLGSAQPAFVPLSESFDAAYFYAGAAHGWLYFQTTLDAPRCRVIAIDPKSPERSRWKEIVPQGADAMDVADGSVTLVADQLIVRTLHDAHSRVAIYGLDGQLRREVELPGSGQASGFGGEPDDPETFYGYTDLVTPPTIYRLDLKTGASTVYRAPKVAFDLGTLESKQVFYPGKDGTRISMYLVYRKGLKLDGTNPTLLYGYGGFGIPMLPRFDPARLVWLERGGVFAIANIRGGGEYGEDWHRQGMRVHKQTVFDDFIAAAEWLIAQRYTSTPKLAIEGGSNGGLLVGACLTQRPDLFGAVLAYVGVMDMLRFDQFGQGAGWEGDYGSPHNPEDFKVLYAYSPYHNVRPATRYPATLVVTGDHDTRVMPAHSFKFAAALQAAQAGTAPLLLRVQLSAGHGGGPTTSQVISEKADAYAFLVQALGMDAK